MWWIRRFSLLPSPDLLRVIYQLCFVVYQFPYPNITYAAEDLRVHESWYSVRVFSLPF